MTIAVGGLGLIGGSFCLAIKKRTKHTVLGIDVSKKTVSQALAKRAIDEAISPSQLGRADLTILGLYPEQTIRFLEQYQSVFAKGSIVCDTCGVKGEVVRRAQELLQGRGVRFVGLHPMAGREFSGFCASSADLFCGASLVVVRTEKTDQEAVNEVASLAKELGFSETVFATPDEHDRIIAFTSQLAHVVSNAYIKSPTALLEHGFTGGSFQDLTRVAMLNETMWTELFLMNRKPLLHELERIIGHLLEYDDALKREDKDKLQKLLREGSDLKKKSLGL